MSDPIHGAGVSQLRLAPSDAVGEPALGGGDISELVVALQAKRAEVIEGRLRLQLGEIRDRTNLLKNLGACLSALAQNTPGAKGYAGSYGSFVDAEGKSRDVKAFLETTTGLTLGDPPPKWFGCLAIAVNFISGLSGIVAKFADSCPELKQIAKTCAVVAGMLEMVLPIVKKIAELVEGREFGGDAPSFERAKTSAATKKEASQSDSQEDMLILQKLMDQDAKTYETITNTIAKTNKNRDGILANLR